MEAVFRIDNKNILQFRKNFNVAIHLKSKEIISLLSIYPYFLPRPFPTSKLPLFRHSPQPTDPEAQFKISYLP